MKSPYNIRCYFGLHKWDRSQTVEPSGHTGFIVHEDSKCKRCNKRESVERRYKWSAVANALIEEARSR